MASNHLRETLDHLRQILRLYSEDGRSDGQLLTHFIATRDEAAFAALVQRHGPMVLGICRRVLRHDQDAEDAFQASFLVLARKASSILHRQTVASWLYRVSYRIALEAKVRSERRRAREKQVEDMPHPMVMPAELHDWLPWLDHELNRLSEKYRTAVILCDLEGRSRREAARQLAIPEGTLSSRLATARRLLAKRLARCGTALSGGALAAVLAESAAPALPPPLALSTVLAASERTMVSASVGVLMKGALKVMFLSKLKVAVGAVMVAAVVGATGLVYRASGQDSPAPAEKKDAPGSGQPKSVPAEKRGGEKPPTELEILRREVELLKLKLEVVQEKQRAQEKELRALRAASNKSPQPEVVILRDQVVPPSQEVPLKKMLTDVAYLRWPKSLQGGAFKGIRENFFHHLKQARDQLGVRQPPDAGTLFDLQTDLAKLNETLDDRVESLTADQFLGAKRYLKRLEGVLAALRMFDGKHPHQQTIEALETAVKKLREVGAVEFDGIQLSK